jgi:hypothetical protein
MKQNRILFGLILSTVILGLVSCEKEGSQRISDIEGRYVGSFSKSTSLKSTLIYSSGEHDGIAEVTMMGEHQIQVHCYGNEIDTTFMLDYFEHNDSVMVCLTGHDFENTYGNMSGEGHMTGGMMGDISSGETEWMHHMNDEHEEGDEHPGGFDMVHGTFSYYFRMMENHTPYYLKFHGIKD